MRNHTNKNRNEAEGEYVIGSVKLHDSADSLHEYDPITCSNNHDMIRQKYFTRSIKPTRSSVGKVVIPMERVVVAREQDIETKTNANAAAGEDFEDMLQMMIEIKNVAQEEIKKWEKKYEKLKDNKEKWKRRALKAMQVNKADATSHAKDLHKKLASSSGRANANPNDMIPLSSSATAIVAEDALHIYYQERENELMEALEGVVNYIEKFESFTVDSDVTRDRARTNTTNTTIFSNDSSVYDQDMTTRTTY